MYQRLGCWVFLGLVLSGCGDGGKKLANLVPVSGIVTLDNNPLPQGLIGFVPVNTGGEQPASAAIKDGRFTLVTSASSPGVVAGEYEVLIISNEQTDPPSAPIDGKVDGQTDPAMMAKMTAKLLDTKNPPPPPVSLIPTKYNKPKTSGLKVSVQAGMKPLQIDLSSEK